MTTRFMGLLKGVGGLCEAAAGTMGGIATSWTGVGAVAGGVALFHGSDVAVSGFNQMISGRETSSFTSKGLQAIGVSYKYAENIDAGVSIALTGGAYRLGTIGGVNLSTPFQNVTTQLNKIAKKAIQINGRGSGAAYGNKVHATFSKLANNLSVDGYTIRTEVSYLNGKIVPYGTKGSARIDAALYDSHGQLVHAYDLKTGGASLSTNQIRHIQTQTRSKINVTKITGQ